MSKTKGLGRGLDALFAQDQKATATSQGRELNIKSLVAGRYQPRTHMDETSLQSLAASIKAQGLIQPIMVRLIDTEKYEIIAGERRWRAAKIAGLKSVPVVIREVSDDSALSMALIENIQREDLNPIEEALGIDRLIKEFGMTHETAAKSLGKSRSAISNLLRLLNLEESVQNLLMASKIDMGHARALLSLEKATQAEIASRIVTLRLSVRETERLVNTGLANRKEKRKDRKPRDLERLENELTETLGTLTTIKHQKRGNGILLINYSNLDQLDFLIKKLKT